jgi:hypothetical protein
MCRPAQTHVDANFFAGSSRALRAFMVEASAIGPIALDAA